MLERISELGMKGRGNKGREISAVTSGDVYAVLSIWGAGFLERAKYPYEEPWF